MAVRNEGQTLVAYSRMMDKGEMKMEAAKVELQRRKMYFPFRQWFAIEHGGEWHYFDSMRKLKAFMRKNNITKAYVLSA